MRGLGQISEYTMSEVYTSGGVRNRTSGLFNWMQPTEYTDFTRQAANLNNQWVLLERRANTVLPASEMAALRLVTGAYVDWWNAETKKMGAGWFFSEDRDRLEQFKRSYDLWYKRVEQYDPALETHVARPEVTVGYERGLFEKATESITEGFTSTADTLADRFQDFIASEYAMPVMLGSIAFFGFVWMTSRSGARSGTRYEYVRRR
jgi:hypothetical protein